MTERATAAGAMAHADKAHDKIKSHEDLCAERYERIHETLTELKAGANAQNRLQWGVLIAIAAFFAVQFVDGLKDDPAPVQAVAVAPR